MTDNRTPASRSALMARVRSRDTSPEMAVRRMLHSMGHRFRLHRKGLPGTPDVVLPKHRKIIFVNGCFWHGHGCKMGRPPRSRPEFWLPKIQRNRERDAEKTLALEHSGWRVLTVWQCQTRNAETLRSVLDGFMVADQKTIDIDPRA
jgi:DNA mismatch endonuclease, patch repair protein